MAANKLGMYVLLKDLSKTFWKETQTAKMWLKETNIWNELEVCYNKRCKFTYMYPVFNLFKFS